MADYPSDFKTTLIFMFFESENERETTRKTHKAGDCREIRKYGLPSFFKSKHLYLFEHLICEFLIAHKQNQNDNLAKVQKRLSRLKTRHIQPQH